MDERDGRDNLPLISICVINYNGSKYLTDCIRSILGQTYPNIEIVFCDDASTDDSVEMFEKLVKNSNLKVIKQIQPTNCGAEGNMIAGLKSFSGDYVCNIDSDDILLPNHIETLYRLIISGKGYDISSTNHMEFSKVSDLIKHLQPDKLNLDDLNILRSSTKEVLSTLFLGKQKIPFAYWHRLYKRHYAKRIEEIPSSYFKNSDSSFSLYQLCESNTIIYADIATYCYRVRQNSVSRKSKYRYTRDKTLNSLNELSVYYSRKYPDLLELNKHRNNKATAWMIRECIEEGYGYRELTSCYKSYVTKENSNYIIDELTEGMPRIGKLLSRLLWTWSPLGYFISKNYL